MKVIFYYIAKLFKKLVRICLYFADNEYTFFSRLNKPNPSDASARKKEANFLSLSGFRLVLLEVLIKMRLQKYLLAAPLNQLCSSGIFSVSSRSYVYLIEDFLWLDPNYTELPGKTSLIVMRSVCRFGRTIKQLTCQQSSIIFSPTF